VAGAVVPLDVAAALGDAALGDGELLGRALPVGKAVDMAEGLGMGVPWGEGFAFSCMQSPDVTVALTMQAGVPNELKSAPMMTCDGCRVYSLYTRSIAFLPAWLYTKLVHTRDSPLVPAVLMNCTLGGGEIMQVELKVIFTTL